MIIDAISQRMLVVCLVGTILVIARRWKNKDSNAGVGLAGWTIVVIIVLATDLL